MNHQITNKLTQIIFSLENKLLDASRLSRQDISDAYKNDKDMASHLIKRFLSSITPHTSTPQIALFFQGIDTMVQRKLFPILSQEHDAIRVMYFFHWIVCGVAPYMLKQDFSDEIYNKWTELDSIQFFFTLSKDQQIKLINLYCDKNDFTYMNDDEYDYVLKIKQMMYQDY